MNRVPRYVHCINRPGRVGHVGRGIYTRVFLICWMVDLRSITFFFNLVDSLPGPRKKRQRAAGGAVVAGTTERMVAAGYPLLERTRGRGTGQRRQFNVRCSWIVGTVFVLELELLVLELFEN